MTRIQNTSPLGDLDVPLLRRIVKAGEIVDVRSDHAALLLAQTGTWAAPAKTTRAPAPAEDAAAAALAALADATTPVTTEQGGTPA